MIQHHANYKIIVDKVHSGLETEARQSKLNLNSKILFCHRLPKPVFHILDEQYTHQLRKELRLFSRALQTSED